MKKRQIWTAAMLLTLVSCGGGGTGDKIDLIPIRRNGDTYVYVNNRADIVVQPEMKITQSSVFRGKYAVVRVRENGKFGFLNRNGQLEIPAIYSEASCFSEGLAWVVKDGVITAIDREGHDAISLPDARKARWFSEGLAAVEFDDYRWGYVDKTGKTVIGPTVYLHAGNFSNGLAVVRTNDGYTWINRKGKKAIGKHFEFAADFGSNGYAVVQVLDDYKESMFGVINRKGDFVVEPEYNRIIPHSNDFLVCLCKKDGCVFGYLNDRGKTTIPLKFGNLLPFMGSRYAGARLSGEKKYGIVDLKGEFVVEPQFGYFATPFVNGVAVVKNSINGDDGTKIINEKGETVMEIYPSRIDRSYFYAVYDIFNPTGLLDLYGMKMFESYDCVEKSTYSGEEVIKVNPELLVPDFSPK